MKRPAALFVGTALLVSGCGDIGCGNEERLRVASPSGRMEAVVFNRNCGATTGFNTQLSIVRSGRPPEGAGNVLILDDTVPLKIVWTSDDSLDVKGVGGAKVFHQSSSFNGVAVSYGK